MEPTTNNTNNTTPVPPEHQESADYLEQLAQEYEAKGQWGIAEIARGAISKLALVGGEGSTAPRGMGTSMCAVL